MHNNNNNNGRNNNQRRNNNYVQPEREFQETVVQINRISKKTKGGNQMRFAALVVVGDKKGKVGVGLSKAKDVRGAIQKAVSLAKRNFFVMNLRGTTIPYEVRQKYGAAKIVLKPAPAGSGIIAGGAIRVVLDALGVKDASGKIMGTKNKITNVYATIEALKSISGIDERKKNIK